MPSYSCHVCGFETELNVQFVSHMSLHVDKEQWMFSICCTACDFVTMEEAEMKAHIGTKHTGNHPCRSFSPPSPNHPGCLPSRRKHAPHQATRAAPSREGRACLGEGGPGPACQLRLLSFCVTSSLQ